MAHTYTPVVKAAIAVTKFLHLKGGDKNEFSRRIESFARYGDLTGAKLHGLVCDRTEPDFTAADVVTVKKKAGSDLKILNIADIHFSDYDYRLIYGFNAMRKVRRLVRKYKPDMITMTGDQTCDKGNLYSIKYLVRCFEAFGIPWVPVFGNHDSEGTCDRNYLADEMMKGKNCLFRKGPTSLGCGNYMVRIEEEDSGRPVHAMMMMDFCHGPMDEAKKKWFREGAAFAGCECSVFGHEPLTVYGPAFDAVSTDGRSLGEDRLCAGVRGEKEAAVGDEENAERSFFDEIVNSGNTKFVFCGHDHLNDYSVDCRGVRLTYMLKTGKGAGNTCGLNGASLITVGDDGIKNVSHITASLGKPWLIQSIDYENGEAVRVNKNVRFFRRIVI